MNYDHSDSFFSAPNLKPGMSKVRYELVPRFSCPSPACPAGQPSLPKTPKKNCSNLICCYYYLSSSIIE